MTGRALASVDKVSDPGSRLRPDIDADKWMRRLALRIGDLDVISVGDGIGRLRPEVLFSYNDSDSAALGKGAKTSDWNAYPGFLDSRGRLEMPSGSFVVRSADRLVLVDAGLGEEVPPTVSGTRLLENLRNEGIEASDITDVILTHLHPDHIGWCSSDSEAVFANATYRCNEADWDFFVGDPRDAGLSERLRKYRRVAKKLLLPISGRFEVWQEKATIAPGVDVVAAPGHTPGNSVVALSSRGVRALLLGDVVHCPVQLVDDDWERVIDVDPILARKTAREIARQIESDSLLAVGSHFPGLKFGRVIATDARRAWIS